MKIERSVSNEIWLDDYFMELHNEAKLLLLGIMTHVNDEGEMRAHTGLLTSLIMASINSDPLNTKNLLSELESRKFIAFFVKDDGREWLRLNPDWLGKRTSQTPQSAYGHISYWQNLRARVKHRDNWTCTRCGTTEGRIVAHHILPLASGGKNEMSNLTTLCQSCHRITHAERGDF